jgi:hypothetical protein
MQVTAAGPDLTTDVFQLHVVVAAGFRLDRRHAILIVAACLRLACRPGAQWHATTSTSLNRHHA